MSDPLSPSVGHMHPPVFRYSLLVTGVASPDSGPDCHPETLVARPALGRPPRTSGSGSSLTCHRIRPDRGTCIVIFFREVSGICVSRRTPALYKAKIFSPESGKRSPEGYRLLGQNNRQTSILLPSLKTPESPLKGACRIRRGSRYRTPEKPP